MDLLSSTETALRKFALTFPDSTEEFPWGERAIKVKGKIFVCLSRHTGDLHLSCKLPVSGSSALEMPGVEPTGYGLGKHGWVTAKFTGEDAIPLDLLREWVDESFRAVAPKTVLAKLEHGEMSQTTVKPAKKKPKKQGR
jgi:predicted DNA-binding protein (MmcQ/YjbR family)